MFQRLKRERERESWVETKKVRQSKNRGKTTGGVLEKRKLMMNLLITNGAFKSTLKSCSMTDSKETMSNFYQSLIE